MSVSTKSSGKFTISQAIDSIGVNKFTMSIFFLVGIAMMFDGYDYMIISYTNTQIAAEWGLDAVAKGALASWSTIGIVVGSFAAGPLSDKLGRRRVLTWGCFAYGLLTVPCIFAPNYEVFAFFRVAAGLFLGVCTPVVTTMFTEFTPTKQRSFFITFGMAWMIVGWVMAALVGTVVVQLWTWHVCYAIGSLPVLYAWVFGKFTPESAHWYAVRGNLEGAVTTLKRIEKRSGKEIPYELKVENILVPPVSAKSSPAEVWKGKYLKTTFALVVIYFAGNFTIYGVNAWLPSIMLARGYELTSAYLLAMAQNAAAVVANCTTGFVSEAIGRKKNLILGYVVSVASCFLAAFASGSIVIVLGSLLFLGFALNYAITAAQPMMSESYPTEFRNSGVATIVALGKSAGIISPIIMGALVGLGFDFTVLFSLLAIPMALGALAGLLLPKGAKGMTIDDVAEEENADIIAKA
ncbi:MAG: MFS transporter [Raoultibacter sp.]